MYGNQDRMNMKEYERRGMGWTNEMIENQPLEKSKRKRTRPAYTEFANRVHESMVD